MSFKYERERKKTKKINLRVNLIFVRILKFNQVLIYIKILIFNLSPIWYSSPPTLSLVNPLKQIFTFN